MRRRKADEGVDFEALRHAIEHCNVDVMLGFYAEDARLSILNARAQRSIPFELRGKPEIAKHFALWRRGERGCDRVGGDALVEANFAYNVADWKPDVIYEVEDDTGKLSVEQGSGQGVRLGGEARNEWVLRFNDEVPTDLQVEMGAGESNLDLDSLTLTGLDLKIGADQTMVDLTGDYQQDLDASIQGGVGEATVRLASEIG
jgi:hypothetical protein